mmetsp:Transcript_58688/g.157174  ORF Transcript_58688/g.157174 Transcript_58688/m.157174 type:complete len:274 (+) Transcript_58688:577-1398(+)
MHLAALLPPLPPSRQPASGLHTETVCDRLHETPALRYAGDLQRGQVDEDDWQQILLATGWLDLLAANRTQGAVIDLIAVVRSSVTAPDFARGCHRVEERQLEAVQRRRARQQARPVLVNIPPSGARLVAGHALAPGRAPPLRRFNIRRDELQAKAFRLVLKAQVYEAVPQALLEKLRGQGCPAVVDGDHVALDARGLRARVVHVPGHQLGGVDLEAFEGQKAGDQNPGQRARRAALLHATAQRPTPRVSLPRRAAVRVGAVALQARRQGGAAQ